MRKSLGIVCNDGGKLSISLGFTHNVVFTFWRNVFKFGVYALIFQPFFAAFYPTIKSANNLLHRWFYTQSTDIITKTTIFNKTLIMESV